MGFIYLFRLLLEELDPPKITGPSGIPPCGQQTYILDRPVPAGYTVSWSVTPDLNIVSSNATSVTVAPNQNTTTAKITAAIGQTAFYNCNPQLITKDVTSQPAANYQIKFRTLPGCYYEAYVSPVIPGDQYAWSTDGVTYVSSAFPSGYRPAGIGYIARTGANDPIWAVVTPACPQEPSRNLFTSFTVQQPDPGPGGCAYRLAPNIGEAPGIQQIAETGGVEITPNPTTGDWLVHLYFPASRVQARLTNATGQTIWTARETKDFSGSLLIPGTTLSPGAYFLTLTVDGKVSNHRLMKQ